MYLKSISIENYRRFQKKQTFEFAHSNWSKNINNMTYNQKEVETERYISQSMSLLVGKNNAGKSTVIRLLNKLQSTRCGNRTVFKCTDFNLNYLHKWYVEHDLNSLNEIEDLPCMEFELTLGIDDGNDTISDFKDVLVLGGINDNSLDDEVAEVSIKIKYEVADEKKFKKALFEIVNRNENDNFSDEIEKETEGKLASRKQNREELRYRRFLSLFSKNYYILNFYPLRSNEPAEHFSLASLFKVNIIDANTIKGSDTLSRAYSKIVSSYAKNNNLDRINKTVQYPLGLTLEIIKVSVLGGILYCKLFNY